MIDRIMTWPVFGGPPLWVCIVVGGLLLILLFGRPVAPAEATRSPPPGPGPGPEEPLVQCSNCAEYVRESDVETEDAGGIFGYGDVPICRLCKYDGALEDPP